MEDLYSRRYSNRADERVNLTFAALAFFFDPGEEVASDALDVKETKYQGSRS